MKVRFEMAARDMLPATINLGYERAGLPERVDGTADVWMFREVDWEGVPREGDEVDVGVEADPLTVKRVHWRHDGVPVVSLGTFDTDQVGDESAAIESLIEAGWQIEVEA